MTDNSYGYVGNRPVIGSFRKLDNIATGFNGITTTFAMLVGGIAIPPAGSANQLVLSINGIVQEPGVAFVLSSDGLSIIFTTAPPAGSTFFAILLGDVLNVPVPADGSVGANQLANLSVTANKLAPGAVVTSSFADGSVTSPKLAAGAVANANLADSSVTVTKLVDGVISTNKLADNSVSTAKIIDHSITTGKISTAYAPNVNVSSGTKVFDISIADWYKVTVTGNATFAFMFTNGQCQNMTLEIVNGGLYTITWPANLIWDNSVIPRLQSAGTDHIEIYKDGNDNVYARMLSRKLGTNLNIPDNRLTGLVPLQYIDAAGLATIDFTSLIDSAYDYYQFELYNITVASSGVFYIETSGNNGASYDITSTSYMYQIWGHSNTSNAAYTAATTSQILPFSSNTILSTFVLPIFGTVKLYSPSNSTNYKSLSLNMGSQSGGYGLAINGIAARLSINPINAIRFGMTNSSSFTGGRAIMYGGKHI